MKNKYIVAIVAGILCAGILTTGLVWSMLDGEDPKEESGENSQSQLQPTDAQTPDEGKQETPDESEKEPEKQPEKEQNPDEGKQEKPDESEKVPEEKPAEKPVEQPAPKPADGSAGYVGNAVIATMTKEEIETMLNDPFMLLVNRDHRIGKDFNGLNLTSYNGDHRLNDVTASALRQLISAGKSAGYNYVLYSGYRSYSTQYNIYYGKVSRYKNQGYSEEEAIRLTNQYSAPPGASEHQTGLAADVCIPSIVNKYDCLHENYEYTDEYKWFSAHAHEYGFILRYRKGDEAITGYNFEPWHYRYVGVDVATEIYKMDVTFEEYVEALQARLAQLNTAQ